MSPRSRKKTGTDWAAIARDYAAGVLTVSEICALYSIHENTLYRHARRESWKKRASRMHRRNVVNINVATDAPPTRDQMLVAANDHLSNRPGTKSAKPRSSPALDALCDTGQPSGARPLSCGLQVPCSKKESVGKHSRLTARSPKRRPRNLARRLLIALDKKMTEFENRLAEGEPLSAADSERDARTLNTLAGLFDKLQTTSGKPRCTKSSALPSPANATGNHPHDADRLRHDLAQRLEKLRQGLSG